MDGHVRAFDHFGVPRSILDDNLRAAVEKILKVRDRLESECFVALRSHYGFCYIGPLSGTTPRSAGTRCNARFLAP